jgi:hypothetical protein
MTHAGGQNGQGNVISSVMHLQKLRPGAGLPEVPAMSPAAMRLELELRHQAYILGRAAAQHIGLGSKLERKQQVPSPQSGKHSVPPTQEGLVMRILTRESEYRSQSSPVHLPWDQKEYPSLWPLISQTPSNYSGSSPLRS